ncbi:MAG: hypothetical protein QOE41_4572 [Mycobacterium sp.]|jgi:hypothetical protein|nr:hemerythrin [Mycobacterium sp.]MDT5135261.1 hypothetical protein [Mycobacterium sp.]
MIVHPRARKEIQGGDEVVRCRLLEEENQAKKQLAQIEKTDIGSQEFVESLTEFHGDVIDRAEHEENEEFNTLQREVHADDLKRMTAAVRAAEAIAPTRPHPGVESAMANFALGPFASLLDHARDAIQAGLRVALGRRSPTSMCGGALISSRFGC